MNGIRTSRGILDSDAVMQVTFGEVIGQLSNDPTTFKTFHECVEAADEDRSFVAGEHGAILGVNVEHTGGSKTELRRQRSGNQRNVIGEPGLQFLAKTRNTFGQKHVIDPILQIGVLAADVKLPE